MSKPESVGPRKVITMHYSLTNADGVVVREATGTPVSYLHGAGLLFPKLESELAELDDTDRDELLESVGLEEPALAALTREAYGLLGLQSYFTAGEKEVRAWTTAVGATAPQAAGVIHSDFEQKFIRAEVYTLDDLVTHKNEKTIREAGKMRAEGKTYVVQDGDIMHFLTGA